MTNIDFNSLPLDFQNILATFLVVPMWYVVIYVFGPEIYATNDMILIFSICISLSLLSSLILAAGFEINDEDLFN